ncbi:MAG: tetratricopeptide repeat protein [Segetibacter sp.]
MLNALGRAYLYSRPDTALVLAQQGLLLAKKTGFAKGEAESLNRIATVFAGIGNYPKALQLFLEALKKAEATGDEETCCQNSFKYCKYLFLPGRLSPGGCLYKEKSLP